MNKAAKDSSVRGIGTGPGSAFLTLAVCGLALMLTAGTNDQPPLFVESAAKLRPFDQPFASPDNGTKEVVFQPGPDKGQDGFVRKLSNLPGEGGDDALELPIGAWMHKSTPYSVRSFITFNQLSTLPYPITIVSAKLYLTGVSSSAVFPLGNSFYPGSSYDKYGQNAVVVQQLVDKWDPTTLNFDNQPSSATANEAVVAASTSQWRYNGVADVTKMVQSIADNSSKNFGFALKMQTEENYRSMVFASFHSADETARPRLVIDYQVPPLGSTPPPPSKTPPTGGVGNPTPPPDPTQPDPIGKTLTLQPYDGHDVYTVKYEDVRADPNYHNVSELPIGQWTCRGVPTNIRTFIKFFGLSKLPPGTKVLQAKLFLTGVSKSLVGPQGDSVYPGSPYGLPNRVQILRVLDPWDEQTLTADNQPSTTLEGMSGLPSSTRQWNQDAKAIVTEMVQKMVDDPKGNHGFELRMEVERAYRYIVFASSTSSDPNARPKLVVIYQ